MARYALVVGIAQYDNFRNLDKAATDAAAIARLLQVHGHYQVEPLPKRLVAAENRWELATDKKLTGKDLGQTLETFLLEQANGHEALIYFAGHGFEVPGLGRKKKGYLATSDCTSDGRNAILFGDLNDLIRESNLSSLVVILDCCHAGSFLERTLLESTLTAFKEKKDYYLITACRSFERSREGEEHGVFTASVLKGLQVENADSEGAVTGDRLFDFVQRELRQSGQEPIRSGIGRSIILLNYQVQKRNGMTEETTSSVDNDFNQVKLFQLKVNLKRFGLPCLAFLVFIISSFSLLFALSPQVARKLNITVQPSCPEIALREGKLLIVIAKFKDGGTSLNKVIPFIQDKLLDRIKRQNFSNASICLVNESATNEDEARKAGQDLGAEIIVWGRQSTEELEVKVTTLKLPVAYLNSLSISLNDVQNTEKIKDLPPVVHVMTAFALSQIYERSKKQNFEARKILSESIALAQSSEPNLKNKYVSRKLGLAYLFLGYLYRPIDNDCVKTRQDCVEAANAFGKARILDKKITQAFLEEGLTYEFLGASGEAIHVYTQLIEAEPNSESGLEARSNRANLYLAQNMLDEAIKDLAFTCEREPSNYGQLSLLGKAQLLNRDFKDAEETYLKVKKLVAQDQVATSKVVASLQSLAQDQTNLVSEINSIIKIIE